MVTSSDAMQIRDAAPGYGVEAQAQDVPAGYKRTEVGVIPEDWDVSSVGSEFTIQLGKMLDAARNVGEPKPYLGNRAVQWGRIDLEDLPTVPMSPSDIQRFRLREGDLLVCEGGEIGRAAIWASGIPECYYQKALHRLRPTRGYDAYLMQSLLQLWAAAGYLSNYVTQTSIAHLPKDKLESVPLPRPQPAEQRAIAEALSDVDGLLGALEALIAKKRAIKQAAMQQLLTGKTRLPGFSGAWETRRLADVCALKSGVSITSERINSYSSYPCYGGNGLRGFTSTFTHDGDYALIGRQGALCGNVIGASGKFFASEHALVVTPREAIDIHWLTYLLGRMQLNQYSESSAQPGLSAAKLLFLEFPCPATKAEQTAIATVLFDMDAEIAALEARRDKTRALKQGMMQQLLTGRVRLVEPEGVT